MFLNEKLLPLPADIESSPAPGVWAKALNLYGRSHLRLETRVGKNRHRVGNVNFGPSEMSRVVSFKGFWRYGVYHLQGYMLPNKLIFGIQASIPRKRIPEDALEHGLPLGRVGHK